MLIKYLINVNFKTFLAHLYYFLQIFSLQIIFTCPNFCPPTLQWLASCAWCWMWWHLCVGEAGSDMRGWAATRVETGESCPLETSCQSSDQSQMMRCLQCWWWHPPGNPALPEHWALWVGIPEMKQRDQTWTPPTDCYSDQTRWQDGWWSCSWRTLCWTSPCLTETLWTRRSSPRAETSAARWAARAWCDPETRATYTLLPSGTVLDSLGSPWFQHLLWRRMDKNDSCTCPDLMLRVDQLLCLLDMANMRSGPTEVDRIHEDIVDILQCYSRTCNQTHRELSLDMVLCMRILVVEKVSLWSGELEYHW